MLNVRHTKAAAKIFGNNKNDTKRAVVAANLRPPLQGGGSCFFESAPNYRKHQLFELWSNCLNVKQTAEGSWDLLVQSKQR